MKTIDKLEIILQKMKEQNNRLEQDIRQTSQTDCMHWEKK